MSMWKRFCLPVRFGTASLLCVDSLFAGGVVIREEEERDEAEEWAEMGEAAGREVVL